MKMSQLRISKMMLLFVILFLFCCNQNNLCNNTENKLTFRDSIQIMHVLNIWKELDYGVWGARTDIFNVNEDDYIISPINAFYSPDSLKLVVLLQVKELNGEFKKTYDEDPKMNRSCPGYNDTIYNFTGVIGIRENLNQIWDVYEFNERAVTCCENPISGFKELELYYFQNMKNDFIYVDIRSLDIDYGGKVLYEEYKADTLKYKKDENYLVLKEYGYNLNDDGFWDKNLLWQKGARIKDYYVFQSNNLRLIKKPEILYPKEILELFNK